MKKTLLHRIAVITALLTFVFVSLPLASGDSTADAAGVKAPKIVKSVSAWYYRQYMGIRWDKVDDFRAKGYAIYRDGVLIARISSEDKKYRRQYRDEISYYYSDYDVEEGKTYTYRVCAYNTYRQKGYWNTKTKKWQKKPPASKKRKRLESKIVTWYKYGKKSDPVKRMAVWVPPCGGVHTDIHLIDYLGRLTGGDYYGTVDGKAYYIVIDSGEKLILPKEQLAKWARWIDGEFFADDGEEMFQKKGVTFVKHQLIKPEPTLNEDGIIEFTVEMYNGDKDKLSFEIQNQTQEFDNEGIDENEGNDKRVFIVKDEQLIAEYLGLETSEYPESPEYSRCKHITSVIKFGKVDTVNLPQELSKEGIVINIKYDGEQIGQIAFTQ